MNFFGNWIFRFGGIQQLRGQFLYPERGQKQAFFDPLSLIVSTLLLNAPLANKFDFSGSFMIEKIPHTIGN